MIGGLLNGALFVVFWNLHGFTITIIINFIIIIINKINIENNKNTQNSAKSRIIFITE